MLAARDAGSKAALRQHGSKNHRCQFSQLRCGSGALRHPSARTTACGTLLDNSRCVCRHTRAPSQGAPYRPAPSRIHSPSTKLQRLAAGLLRHFGLPPYGAPPASTATSGGAGAAVAVGSAAGGAGWQVLLFPDLAAHGHLKNTSWGPVISHDITVWAGGVFGGACGGYEGRQAG